MIKFLKREIPNPVTHCKVILLKNAFKLPYFFRHTARQVESDADKVVPIKFGSAAKR